MSFSQVVQVKKVFLVQSSLQVQILILGVRLLLFKKLSLIRRNRNPGKIKVGRPRISKLKKNKKVKVVLKMRKWNFKVEIQNQVRKLKLKKKSNIIKRRIKNSRNTKKIKSKKLS